MQAALVIILRLFLFFSGLYFLGEVGSLVLSRAFWSPWGLLRGPAAVPALLLPAAAAAFQHHRRGGFLVGAAESSELLAFLFRGHRGP